MDDTTNELSDIVLNKGSNTNSNKKILLAVATLGVVLIIVVMLMNSMNSGSNNNLPQAVLPPKPQKDITQQDTQEEPLFEEVEVLEDDTPTDTNLDEIAKKLKQESNTVTKTEKKAVQKTVKTTLETDKTAVNKVLKKSLHKKTAAVKTKETPKVKKAVASGNYYVQVGSFSKYEPNKKFLNSITKLGFHYKYHKVENLNKVLVGPFKSRKEADKAKKVLRAKVINGAFIVKL